MRLLAVVVLVPVLVSCTTTTRVAVKGEALYRHLDELRTTGRADVPTETLDDDDQTRASGLETVTLDTKLTHGYRSGSLLQFSRGCETRDAEGQPVVKLDGCYFGIYGQDPFVLRETSRFEAGLALKATAALLGFVAYGLMVNCMWNCEDETHANISLVGVGIVTVTSTVFAIAKASD